MASKRKASPGFSRPMPAPAPAMPPGGPPSGMGPPPGVPGYKKGGSIKVKAKKGKGRRGR